MDVHSELNDNGDILWTSVNGVFYRDVQTGETVTLSDKFDPTHNYDYTMHPLQINNNKTMVWSYLNEVYLFNGSETILVSDTPNNKFLFQLNEEDLLVWFEQVEGFWQVMYYNGSIVGQVTTGSNNSVFPELNNINEIVWSSFDGTDDEIYKATPICQ